MMNLDISTERIIQEYLQTNKEWLTEKNIYGKVADVLIIFSREVKKEVGLFALYLLLDNVFDLPIRFVQAFTNKNYFEKKSYSVCGKKYLEEMFKNPASRSFHHNYSGGLFEHSY